MEVPFIELTQVGNFSSNRHELYSLEEVGRVSGVPFAATFSTNSSDLLDRHLKIAIHQKKIFRDKVVNATTGRPVY